MTGIDVAIKGTGLFAKTDDEGRFTLGSIQPGEYTLVVWTPTGKPEEKAVTVPTVDGNYDLEI
jgi:protocatechuate 3,4-dioxygenase beta subunit